MNYIIFEYILPISMAIFAVSFALLTLFAMISLVWCITMDLIDDARERRKNK